MSLFRQLLSLFFAGLLLLTVLIALAQLRGQRDFILQQQQLQLFSSLNTIAQTSKPLIQLEDRQQLDVALSAFFNAGQYRQLTVKRADGELLWQSPEVRNRSSAPLWFQQLGLFETIKAEQQVDLEWRPLAVIELSGDPGLAYQHLWQSMQSLLLALIGTLLVFGVLLAWQLRRLLKPLKGICQQSEAISQRRPMPEQKQRATTKEFAQVQQAFAVVSEYFNKLFKEQAAEANRLKQDLYTDPLTGIGNRELMEASIERWCQQRNPGALALITVPALTSLHNEPDSYRHTIVQLQQDINELLPANVNATLARLKRNELILLLTELPEEELPTVANGILERVNQISVDPLGIAEPDATVSVLFSQQPSNRSDMLARVDKLNLEALERPSNKAHVQSHQQQGAALGRKQWLHRVEQAIAQRQLEFDREACIGLAGELLHFELFCKIHNGDRFHSASAFVPALESLGQTAAFDRFVIEQAIDIIQRDKVQPLAINLCVASLCDSAFIRWLQRLLQQHASLRGKLFFEISEAALYRCRDQAVLACQLLDGTGFGYGIDNFGRYLTTIDYLTELPPPQYVKLDTLYSSDINNEHQRSLLISLCRTAHNLNLKTIATNVKDSEQLEMFRELHVDAVQGLVSKTWLEVQSL